MRPISLLLAAMFASLPSCATSSPIVGPVEFTLAEAADSIPVAYGQMASIDGMLLTFIDVPADSRCPASVQCVWEGDAAVKISVTLACTRATPACAVPELLLTLHTNLEPHAGQYAGKEIRLLALRPAPQEPGPIRKSRYVAWFRIRPVTN